MDDDWDLHAVVRGCATPSTTSSACTTTTAGVPTCSVSNFQPQPDNFSFFPDLFESRKETSVQDLYKPFFLPNTQLISPQNIPMTISPPPSVLGDLQDLPSLNQFQIQTGQPLGGSTSNTTATVVSGTTTNTTTRHSKQGPRPKRRKNQMKRVCQVPAEGLSSDMWSWRKYGQKPIKGSPYPRGYYRCSTSKGCLARKQVERHRSDPNMFIITYTGDHNHPMPTHRNSLAGSTRQKPAASAGDGDKPSCSSPAASHSPVTTEKEDDDFGVSDMAISDDFFAGLEDIAGPSDGDSVSDQFAESLPFPWGDVNTTEAVDGG